MKHIKDKINKIYAFNLLINNNLVALLKLKSEMDGIILKLDKHNNLKNFKDYYIFFEKY